MRSFDFSSIFIMFSPITVKGLSSGLSWPESAVQFVRALSVSEREKLLADEGSLLLERPIHIKGERVDQSSFLSDNNQRIGSCETEITKIIHFQRHGQGYHNLMGDILREAGIKPDIDSLDPIINPWIRPEIVDSPLTEIGKWQCEQQQSLASKLKSELVVVSPLTRTIQTAKITFADNDDSMSPIPWIAHELCREETGVLTCNKRRPLSKIMEDFPDLEYFEMTEDDTIWNPNERENNRSKSERIYDFLVNFIAKRKENSIAIVTHSAWLFHALNAVVDCGSDLELSSWFLTGEIRSIKLTFSSQKTLDQDSSSS
jgi:broad specificity phosphatase PhoE